MSSPSVRRESLPETAQGVDVGALSNAYRYLLDCHAKRKAAKPTLPDGHNDVRNHGAHTATPKVSQK